MTNLFIFNTDFRLRDNPALFHASQNGKALIAIFINNPKKWADHNESNIKIAFQIEHLKKLTKELDELNISLKVIHAEGISDENQKIIKFVKDNEIKEIFINKEYGFNETQRNLNLERDLKAINKKLNMFDPSVFTPESIKTQSNTFFKVFTPFSKAFRSKLMTKKIEVLGLPKRQINKIQNSDTVKNIDLTENQKSILKLYPIGEETAHTVWGGSEVISIAEGGSTDICGQAGNGGDEGDSCEIKVSMQYKGKPIAGTSSMIAVA